MPHIDWIWGVGRRKSSVARVRMIAGSGKMIVNKKELDQYFVNAKDRREVLSPLTAVEANKKFDIYVNVKGGGTSGQAGAVSLGVARALFKDDESLRPVLRAGGHLTRDPRMVERKKYGRKKARKSFQFSKR